MRMRHRRRRASRAEQRGSDFSGFQASAERAVCGPLGELGPQPSKGGSGADYLTLARGSNP
eukprot:15452061-Alexandrium_andersonii.AAC.1